MLGRLAIHGDRRRAQQYWRAAMPTKFEALASSSDMPAAINSGKVMKPAPPARTLIVPANTPPAKSRIASCQSMMSVPGGTQALGVAPRKPAHRMAAMKWVSNPQSSTSFFVFAPRERGGGGLVEDGEDEGHPVQLIAMVRSPHTSHRAQTRDGTFLSPLIAGRGQFCFSYATALPEGGRKPTQWAAASW